MYANNLRMDGCSNTRAKYTLAQESVKASTQVEHPQPPIWNTCFDCESSNKPLIPMSITKKNIFQVETVTTMSYIFYNTRSDPVSTYFNSYSL